MKKQKFVSDSSWEKVKGLELTHYLKASNPGGAERGRVDSICQN